MLMRPGIKPRSAVAALRFLQRCQIQIERSARVLARPDVPIKAFIIGFCAVFVVECPADLLKARLIVMQ